MNIRVRYAPSPTGLQHIGGVRTALFNYFFARSSGGTFILRVEDTDRERYNEESVQDLYETLDWLGIQWDEGPGRGTYGPYVQSERKEIYREYAKKLLDSGNAYEAFDTAEELQRDRDAAGGKGGYDRKFRDMSEREKDRYRDQGIAAVVRFRVPLEGQTTFRDSVLGEVTWANEDINPDPVLLKSDGYPTYHLANVVDDHLMEISHILRAQEWLPSAPLHMLMYQALEWIPPQLCHLPMVMGSDGQKLSKRHGSTSVREFREGGYLPEAIVNYVTRLGWSYDDKQEVFSREELENLFTLDKIQKAPAVFDYKKLEWLNGVYIREIDPADLFDRVVPVLEKSGLISNPATAAEKEVVRGAMPLVQERLKLLTQAPEMLGFLFGGPVTYEAEDLIPKKMDRDGTLRILKSIRPLVAAIPEQSEEQNEATFRNAADELAIKLGSVLMPLRIAVTGSRVSPPLFGSIRLIGGEEATRRVDDAISLLEVTATQ